MLFVQKKRIALSAHSMKTDFFSVKKVDEEEEEEGESKEDFFIQAWFSL